MALVARGTFKVAGTVRLRRGRPHSTVSPGTNGFVSDLDSLNGQVASLKFNQLQELRKAAGPPWRSEHIPPAEAAQRTNDFDQLTPAVLQQAAKLSVSELLQAALGAVTLRKQGMREGFWTPPPGHPYYQVMAQQAAAQRPPSAVSGAPKTPKPKVPTPPIHEIIGGQRVLAGEAMMARQEAPSNPGVPVPVSVSDIARGGVVPGGA